mgnify:CR=1 FL=1
MTRIRTAVLLAAGLGTRMRPLTDARPKPLIEVAGRTLLDRVLDKLAAQGVERAVINVHHFADQMEAHLRGRTDLDIIVSDERACLLETGGGVMNALEHLGREPFFAVNTDVTWATPGDVTYLELAERWDGARMDALLLLADMDRTLGFRGAGDFFLKTDGQLERRGERERAPYVFAGSYVTQADRLAPYPIEPFSANRYWSDFNRRGRLMGAVMTPFWMHVGDPAAREEAERRLRELEEAVA